MSDSTKSAHLVVKVVYEQGNSMRTEVNVQAGIRRGIEAHGRAIMDAANVEDVHGLRLVGLRVDRHTPCPKVKVLRDPVSGLTWAVRVVPQWGRYGREDDIVHGAREPLVEFFDTRHAHTDLGRFVSRYNLSTLLHRPAEANALGLMLDGGVPDRSVSGELMQKLVPWLQGCQV